MLGAEPAVDDTTALRLRLHEPLADDDRFDDEHPVSVRQVSDFVSNRRERAMLDLDQLLVADNVDSITTQLLFNFSALVGVKFLQLFMK